MRVLALVILVSAVLQAGCAKTVYRHAPGADFATRCQAAGVVRCFGFDTDADFNIGVGGRNGAWGQNYGIFPPAGTSDYSRIVRDTTVSVSGARSIPMRPNLCKRVDAFQDAPYHRHLQSPELNHADVGGTRGSSIGKDTGL